MKPIKSLLFIAFLQFFTVMPQSAAETPPPSPSQPPPTKSQTLDPNPGGVMPVPSDGWEGGVTPNNIPAPLPFAPHTANLLFSFQLDGILFIQKAGGSTFTGQLAWTPLFKISRYEMRAELGVALPKNTLGDLFLSVNYELFFRTQLSKDTRVDLGGGAQTFTGASGGTKPILTIQMSRIYDTKTPVNTIFIAYSAFFTPRLIHVFKAGIGFTL